MVLLLARDGSKLILSYAERNDDGDDERWGGCVLFIVTLGGGNLNCVPQLGRYRGVGRLYISVKCEK